MTTWMITGLHDPKWFCNAVENYLRQDYPDKGLVLVENGEGIGVGTYKFDYRKHGIVVIRSEPGTSAPLNAALDWMRSNASLDDWWCKCDADDYYGPGYLSSIQEAIEAGADYAGRCDMYIRTMAGRLWLQERNLRGFCDDIANGPTLAACLRLSGDFPEVDSWGEDTLWCQEMQKQGRRFYALPPEHMCYQRWPDNNHAWPCTDDELRTGCSVPFLDLGPWNLDIVNGVVPHPEGVRLEPPPVELDNLMAVRVLRENLAPDIREALEAGPVALGQFMHERMTI